jgi:tRNA(adenine34) deaminase
MKAPKKELFMRKALSQAKIALKHDEVPIGAIVVDHNQTIIGRGYNKIEKKQSQLAHAEAIAIAKAYKKAKSWRLIGCTIYVTLEPCLMCLGLIALSRIKCVIYGAKSHLFGTLPTDAYDASFYTKGMSIQGGVNERESIELLQNFFRKARKKGKVKQ